MNQGKLEVVKQEMARVNVDILGISKLRWTGMGEFNSDDHYIYYCGHESLRRNGVALIVNTRVWNAVLGSKLKNYRMVSVHFQGEQLNITVLQVYTPTNNAEEAEVEWFYEDLEKERYTHLNAEFQRIARTGKKVFFSKQCKRIEENNRMGRSSGMNTSKRCPFHYRGLQCKTRKSRDTWSHRQIWPWSIKWSRAKANRILPRECTGHSKHPLPTTQEKTPHMHITRWSILKSGWLYSWQPDGEAQYSQQKQEQELTVAQIMNSLWPNSDVNWRK